jgi:rhamnogalacturonan acetylesterase
MKNKWILLLIFPLFFAFQKSKPTLYIIGDSTVKTGSGNGEKDMWGWGSVIHPYFDTTRLHIENHAIGGRSSRTFITEGRWENVLNKLKKGDYLLVQFGHNDESPINDTLRARGTIKGIGDEKEVIENLMTQKTETVYTYGHYMRQYAYEAKAKGVKVIICAPVPRNNFGQDGKIKRPLPFYQDWAKEIAKETKSDFINLHELTAKVYETIGREKVKNLYFTPSDNTHTNKLGADLNAQHVVTGIKFLKKNKLKKYLI